MQVERLDDPAEFVRRSGPLCAADPVLTNLPVSIAQSVVDGRRYDEYWWWLVLDDHGRVVGCAMRTAPWNLSLSPMPAEAAVALAGPVAAADPALPGVTGPADTVHALVGALPGARAYRVTMSDVVHVLGELLVPDGVTGEAVPATLDELDVLVDWHERFCVDAGLPRRDQRDAILAKLGSGALLWWQVGGRPVSMAGHGTPVQSPAGAVARIGPVYTPDQFRRNGYAAALTAAVAQRLLSRCSVVMLFADEANRTSNGVYERLGFRPVARMVETELLPAAG